MSPSNYMETWNSPLKNILTPEQMDECRDVVDAADRFIKKKICERYSDMTPEAVAQAEALTVMFGVFVEHAMNPSLLRKAIADG